MKKPLYKIHKWSGLTLGFFLFLLGLSGVGITFREELLPKIYPELFHINEGQKNLPIKDLYTAAQTYLGPHKLTNLYTSESPDEAYLFLYKDTSKKLPMMLTINPFNANIVGTMSTGNNIFAIFLFMHANFFLGKVGSYFVGLLGVLLTFFIISGIYIWLPKFHIKKKLMNTLLVKKVTSQKVHHWLGFIFGIPLLISALTGFLTIYDFSYYFGKTIKNEAERIEEQSRSGDCTHEDQLRVLGAIPYSIQERLISVHLCTQKSNIMKVSYGLHDRDFLEGYGRQVIDPLNGNVLQTFNSETDPASWNLKRLLIYPIHTGEYLGLFGRIIVLLGGFALMGLWLTGLILFIKRRRNQFSPK